MRRILSLLKAMLVLLVTVSGLAVPAAAHAADDPPSISVDGTWFCRPNGTYEVIWSVGNHGSTPAEITSVTFDPPAPNAVGISVGMTIQPGEWISTFLRLPSPLTTATLTVTATWGDYTDTATTTISVNWTCAPFYTVINTCDTIELTFLTPPATRTEGEAGLNGEYRANLWSVAANEGLLAESAEFDMHYGDGPRTLVFPATAGFRVMVVLHPIGASDEVVIGYEPGESWVPPASCGGATPDPAASSADPTGQALPATGNGVGTPIAIGAGLLAAGVILISALFVFRRRRSIAGS